MPAGMILDGVCTVTVEERSGPSEPWGRVTQARSGEEAESCVVSGPEGSTAAVSGRVDFEPFGLEWRPGFSVYGESYSNDFTGYAFRHVGMLEYGRSLQAGALGAERPGFLEFLISGTSSSAPGGFEFEQELVFGDLSFRMSPDESGSFRCTSSLDATPRAVCLGIVPFDLGVPVAFSQSSRIEGGSPLARQDFEGQDTDVLFRLYEADGVTRVALNEVPEPRSLFLTFSALSLIVLLRKRTSQRAPLQ